MKAGEDISLSDAFERSGWISWENLEKARTYQAVATYKHAIPGYEIHGLIGKGAMGMVFKARQIRLDRDVAIKILFPQLANDIDMRRRFLMEAKAAARLSHPNVVLGIDAGDACNTCYFVMELVEGMTADKLISLRGPVDERTALEAIRAVSYALEHAASKGLLHRDIKPGNIMIGKNRIIKLLDLGLAASTDERGKVANASGAAVGTPNYMAPEQALGQSDVDIRSDFYSLGATLYYLLAGEPMFSGRSEEVMKQHISAPPPSLKAKRADVTDSVNSLYLKLVAKNREARPQNAREMERDMDRAMRGQLVIMNAVPTMVSAPTNPQAALGMQAPPMVAPPGSPLPPQAQAQDAGLPRRRRRVPRMR